MPLGERSARASSRRLFRYNGLRSSRRAAGGASPRLEGTIGGVTHTVLNVMSLLLVGAALILLSTFFVGSPLPCPATTAEAVANEEPATRELAKESGSKTSECPPKGRQIGRAACRG